MGRLILEALGAAPDSQIAVTDEVRSLSYAELRQALALEASWLQQAGLRRTALLADNGAAWVLADLALLQLELLHTPLPPWFSPEQTLHVLADAAIDSVLTDAPERFLLQHPTFRPAGAAPSSGLTLLRRDIATPSAAQEGVVKVTYTSGSTGAPKGVRLTRSAIERVVTSLVAVRPSGVRRHLCVTPLATLLENIAGVYAPLALGGTCIVPSSRRTGLSYGGLDPAKLLQAIERAAPQSLIVVPELLRLLVGAARRGWTPPRALEFIAVGGAAVSRSLLEEAAAHGLPVYEGYGLSECASVVCLNTPAANRPGSVGKALPHARVRVDERGEIRVSGAVMSGYLGQTTPIDEEIATGDLGFIDEDGYVYVRGRAKNLFITSMGRNISPEWPEAELLREPSIGRAVVFGEARPWPAALIQPANPNVDDASIERAVAAANTRLPNYAQVRRWLRFAEPPTFANGLMTANGRPRREAIAALHATAIDALYETADRWERRAADSA